MANRIVTLDDVAREAGVSVSTASRTLNGRAGRISVDTQDRVRAVAKRLGYATNLAAQATALGRSRTVGVIVGALPDDYQNPVMVGIQLAAAARGMLVTSAVASIDDIDRMRDAIRQLRGQRPALLTVAATAPADGAGMKELVEELQHAEDEGGRVVLVGIRDTPFDSVVVDDRKAGYDMAVALADAGYRDAMVIAARDGGTISEDRTAGFIQGFADRGRVLAPDRILTQDWTHDGGYRAAGELLQRRPLPEVVFCINDGMAIGATVRIREQGLVIGRDIAVVGCDDIPALRDVDPPLTTIHLPWVEAAEHAFELAQHERSESRSVVLTGYPVMRASAPPLNL